MPPKLALAACILFVLWLFVRDTKCRDKVSSALWIPAIWAAILGSKPVSGWFGVGQQIEDADVYLDGSPLDRFLLFVLIAAGLGVLMRRRVHWREIVADNKWLAAYILYCAISILWSDYPFTAFKRWFKDFGNVVMALIVLSEANPVDAIKTVLARFAYVLVPFSVLLIRYYPETGVYYDAITGEAGWRGVTQFKNQLGLLAAISAIYFVWEFLQPRQAGARTLSRIDVFARLLLLTMTFWLLRGAHSSTSVTCSVLGIGLLVFFTLPFVKKRIATFLTYTLIGAFLFILLSSAFDITGIVLQLLGRNATLTGRTDIWALLLSQPINPLIGTGFGSFWTGERMASLWRDYNGIVQAHNGYLETYLNGGIIGVGLIVGVLLVTGKRISNLFATDTYLNSIKFVLWLVLVVHNWTEASFSKQSVLWLLGLFAIIQYRPEPEAVDAELTEVPIPLNQVASFSSEKHEDVG